jgi:hypothetical protein
MQKHRTRFFALATTVVVGIFMALLLIGPAGAQQKDPYSNDGPNIGPSVIEEPERPAVTDDVTPPSGRGPLPFTGADLTLFVATGIAAVATGSVIVRRTRSRSLGSQ